VSAGPAGPEAGPLDGGDAASERAFRALPIGDRWKVGRDARAGRVRGRATDAAMVAWWGRRELHRLPWYGGLYGGLALLAVAGWIARPESMSFLFAVCLLSGAVGTMIRMPALVRGIAGNQEVVRAAGLDVSTGRPPRVLDLQMILGAAFAVALAFVLLVLWDPVGSPTELTRDLLLPPTPPAALPDVLADGRPTGPVPDEVAAAWPGRDIAAGVVDPALEASLAEPCDADVRWRGDPAAGPVLVGPANLQMALIGPTRREHPSVLVCEYRPDGTLWQRREHQILAGRGMLGGSGSSGEGPDGEAVITNQRDVLVPEGSAWALVDQGAWVLAQPLGGAPGLRTTVTTDMVGEVSPTVGEVRFLDATGRLLETSED
jgi:hypothetical protein